ncbi:transient receptor potential channel pyrexia-like isoform X2 [Solenopsis invicta]|uniref:transient receptor potential channel pyrexia-like isoform X2 n=1 Tax=Solenopsis invicta TaxID=13686 RepID=UPI00193DB1A0|nr:transient receptor potential channel pyrexia-like isoform X2 [Solenopsis invicta]
MQDGDPDHIALISAIKNGKFDNASEILACVRKNKYVGPLGVLQVTALQMAAWQGNIDLLNQLHERGAGINSKDKIGRCALYYAAYGGNADVTKWLLEHGGDVDIKIGIYSSKTEIPNDIRTANMQYSSLERQLPIPDCKERTPLHYAVENNHADVVGILVEHYANVNVEDDSKITPLLLAGNSVNRDDLDEMTKFKEIVRILVGPLGVLQVTALQMAAWQGNIDLLKQLHEKGADINSKDKIGRCALYYAVYNGNTEVTKWLLEHGGDVDIKIGIYSSMTEIPNDIRTANMQYSSLERQLPIPDCKGRTPLHYAVENNHADVVRVLVEDVANVDVEDELRITPLLLAGSAVKSYDLNEMTKFVEIVKILVEAKAFVNAVHPETGNIPLHHAVMLGSAEATKILLSHGAFPIYKCQSSGSTPLHIAASTGNIETLTVLLETISRPFIDIHDQNNHTALHRAVYQGHRECVQALLRRGANLAAETDTGVTAVDAIFHHIAQPFDFLTDVLNSCVQSLATDNSPSKKYENIIIDFGILAPRDQAQMKVVTAIIAAASDIKQLEILRHPVVETFLRLKWERLRIFFFLLILTHLSFVISLSNYALMFAQNDADHVATRRIVATCSCILLLHNIIQIILEPKYYLRQLETWLSFICVILSLIISIAGGFAKCSKEESESQNCMDWMLHSISIAILLSWMQMMLLISRVLMWGDYALMFYTVLTNILKVLLVFGSLIIGFALSFAVLFRGNNQFFYFWNSIKITVVMMMGEYDYDKLFEIKDKFLPVTSEIVFMVFVMLASIVLINLMIGLVVNDIQGLEKEGHIRRLMKQAKFVAHLEKVMSHRIFHRPWLHHLLRKLFRSRRKITTTIVLSSHKKYFRYMNPFMNPPKIPTHLKEALFPLARKSFKNDDLADKNKEIDDTKLTLILSKLEEQIRELKTHCHHNLRLEDRRKDAGSLKRKSV